MTPIERLPVTEEFGEGRRAPFILEAESPLTSPPSGDALSFVKRTETGERVW
jgi:hypothetical protein